MVLALVCFPQGGRSFDDAETVFQELKEKKRLKLIGNVEVRNDGLLSTGNRKTFRSDRDFSRTLRDVLRGFMLDATGLLNDYHPTFPAKETNLTCHKLPVFGYHKTPAAWGGPQHVDPLLKLHNAEIRKRKAAEISDVFDRLYSRRLIEDKLRHAALEEEVDLSRKMLIVEDPSDPQIKEPKIHEIITTVKVTKLEGKVFDCPRPSVDRITYHIIRRKDCPASKSNKHLLMLIRKRRVRGLPRLARQDPHRRHLPRRARGLPQEEQNEPEDPDGQNEPEDPDGLNEPEDPDGQNEQEEQGGQEELDEAVVDLSGNGSSDKRVDQSTEEEYMDMDDTDW